MYAAIHCQEICWEVGEVNIDDLVPRSGGNLMFSLLRLRSSKVSRQLSTAVLSFEQFGNTDAPKKAVFIHGVLGSKKNMRTPCKQFTKLFPEYSCITVDLRGHGSSHSFNEDNTMEGCAHDLNKLFVDKTPDFVCAHSLGGKVALKYIELLVKQHRTLPQNTWILDSLPGLYTFEDSADDSQSVKKVIEALDHIPMVFESRRWVVEELVNKGIALSIAQWLSTSVIDTPEGCRWAFDLPVVKDLFRNFCETNMWPFLEEYDKDYPIHFVRAGRQKKWTDSVLSQFSEIERRNNAVKVHTMLDVGHWLHSEDLPGLLKIITEHNK